MSNLLRLPPGRNLRIFGAASLLADVAGEMVTPILPLFMSGVLGMGTMSIGIAEGIAESTASFAKLVTGKLSDRLARRKPLIIAGYALASLAKPLLAAATSLGHVIGVRFVDRLGKGIRTSPRDALLAESVSADQRGAAFGFHRAMDSAGAIVGPGIAAACLALGLPHRGIFLLAFIPAAAAALILLAVREPKRTPPPPRAAEGAGAGPVRGPFRLYLAGAALFTLGNSSDAFIALRAQGLGLPVMLIPLLWMLQNLVYTLVAVPAGRLSDRLGRKPLLVGGLVLYALVYAGLARATSAWQTWPLLALYGCYYGVAEGGFRAFVADLVPPERLGTAYGWYHAVTGATLLPASLLFGTLWEQVGPATAFLTGSGLALAGGAMVLLVRPPSRMG